MSYNEAETGTMEEQHAAKRFLEAMVYDREPTVDAEVRRVALRRLVSAGTVT
jgi:hypothetical protein